MGTRTKKWLVMVPFRVTSKESFRDFMLFILMIKALVFTQSIFVKVPLNNNCGCHLGNLDFLSP